MKITVKVQHKHIVKGRRADSMRCPLALAFKHDYPDAEFQGIAAYNIWLDWQDGTGDRCYKITPEATKFIKDFDGTRDVKAGELVLVNI